jgi:predicted porin
MCPNNKEESMKKTLCALAVLSLATSLAQAQSSVIIYGIADAGIVKDSGAANSAPLNVSSGVASASRIGFRGAEDFGGGVSALFHLETGFRMDTGAVDTAGAIFNRQAYVGLKSATAGQLTLGRQYTPYYLALSTIADPFGAGLAGSAKNLFPTVGANTRASNAIYYVSPKWSGFNGEVFYSLGEQVGSNSAGRQFGLGLGYAEGKLNVRLAYNNRNNDLTAAAAAAQTPPTVAVSRGIGHNTLLAANYDFGVVKGFAGFSMDKGINSAALPNSSNPFGAVLRPVASTDSRDYLVGLQAPFGAQTIIASIIRKDDRTGLNQDADQWALGATHAFSKRTQAYASVGYIKNKNGAGYTVGNNSDVGTGNRAVNLGVRHYF